MTPSAGMWGLFGPWDKNSFRRGDNEALIVKFLHYKTANKFAKILQVAEIKEVDLQGKNKCFNLLF